MIYSESKNISLIFNFIYLWKITRIGIDNGENRGCPQKWTLPANPVPNPICPTPASASGLYGNSQPICRTLAYLNQEWLIDQGSTRPRWTNVLFAEIGVDKPKKRGCPDFL